jgi:hypothetical protein
MLNNSRAEIDTDIARQYIKEFFIQVRKSVSECVSSKPLSQVEDLVKILCKPCKILAQ